MNRKLVSFLIILLMIFNLSFSTLAESLDDKKDEISNKIEEQSQKLEYVQGEISDAVKEIQELDDKI